MVNFCNSRNKQINQNICCCKSGKGCSHQLAAVRDSLFFVSGTQTLPDYRNDGKPYGIAWNICHSGYGISHCICCNCRGSKRCSQAADAELANLKHSVFQSARNPNYENRPYLISLRLQIRYLINPKRIICFLLLLDIDYATYQRGGEYIDFWLKPAVVALGLPLYRQLPAIRKQVLPLLVSELCGCVAGIVSVVVIAKLLGASHEVIMSLAPKAVTTPIAMEVSAAVGGIPSLTAAVVVSTGIFGGIAGFKILKLSRVKSPIAQGLSMGTAAHAVGTSAAMERSERYGAFSSLGLTLNGLLTAILAPFVLHLIGAY